MPKAKGHTNNGRRRPTELSSKPPASEKTLAPLGLAPVVNIPPPHPKHRGEAVRVGPYTVLAGGTRDLTEQDLEKADVLIPLLQDLPPLVFGRRYEILAAPLQDFGGVPAEWGDFLRQQVIPLLAEGRRVLAFCMGSHGRTGTFLASLIALLEPGTADPIAAARERHCRKAVESRLQAEAIFALRGEGVPERYNREFAPRLSLLSAGWASDGSTSRLGWPAEENSDAFGRRLK